MLKKKIDSFLRSVVVAVLAVTPLAAVVMPTTAGAVTTNYYVDVVNGNDSTHDGKSLGQAWKTFGKAASTVTAGAIVHVQPGTYSEPNLTIANSGTSSDPIIFVSDAKGAAKLKNSSGSLSSLNWYVLRNDGSYVTIDGFDIEGVNWGGNTKILNNKVHDVPANTCGSSGGSGIVNADYAETNGDIIGNFVYNIGPASPTNTVQGIYHSINGGKILNNVVVNASGWGIHLWHAATNTTISGNTSVNNATGGIIYGAGDNPGGVIANNIVVSNNIVADNGTYGIREYNYSAPAADQLGTNNKIYNNIVYNNPTNITTIKAQSLGNVVGNITSDPLFINNTGDQTGDYRLQPASPAIDAGTSTGAPTYDYANYTRPIGGFYDIGAYENLLTNPSFDKGTSSPNGWTTFTDLGATATWDTAEHKDGTRSVKVIGNGGTSRAKFLLVTPTQVKAGKSYTLKGYYKSSSIGTANRTFLKITYYNSSGTTISDAYAYVPTGSQSTWTLMSVTSTAPAGALTAQVEAYAWQNTGTAWFDSLSLLEN